jgi:hypothetical protein
MGNNLKFKPDWQPMDSVPVVETNFQVQVRRSSARSRAMSANVAAEWAEEWVNKVFERCANPSYGVNDLQADSYVGDLPWNRNDSIRVVRAIKRHQRFEELMQTLEARFPDRNWRDF